MLKEIIKEHWIPAIIGAVVFSVGYGFLLNWLSSGVDAIGILFFGFGFLVGYIGTEWLKQRLDKKLKSIKDPKEKRDYENRQLTIFIGLFLLLILLMIII